MIRTSEYVKALIDKINETHICYYEDVPKGIEYPYMYIPTININGIGESGETSNFDIQIWHIEGEDGDIDDLADAIRNALDRITINKNGSFTSHIYFQNQNIVRDLEPDLILRELSFTARIFYM